VSPTGCGSGNFVRPTGTFVSILTSSVGHGCLETNSWVVPTSFSLLALKQWFPPNGASQANFRIELGVQMLLDRVCPGGGWNAGNGVVYGVPLAPHPDATAIALVALVTQTLNPTVQQSLDWLEHAVLTRSAPWSLAWALIALQSHQRSIREPHSRLCNRSRKAGSKMPRLSPSLRLL